MPWLIEGADDGLELAKPAVLDLDREQPGAHGIVRLRVVLALWMNNHGAGITTSHAAAKAFFIAAVQHDTDAGQFVIVAMNLERRRIAAFGDDESADRARRALIAMQVSCASG